MPIPDLISDGWPGLPTQLPAVGALQVSAEINTSLVHLSWDVVDDPRIVGYRIYRAVDNGEIVPIGSTLTNGYVDLKAVLDNTFRYAVTAYSADGYESPLSGELPVALFSSSAPTAITTQVSGDVVQAPRVAYILVLLNIFLASYFLLLSHLKRSTLS